MTQSPLGRDPERALGYLVLLCRNVSFMNMLIDYLRVIEVTEITFPNVSYWNILNVAQLIS